MPEIMLTSTKVKVDVAKISDVIDPLRYFADPTDVTLLPRCT